MQEGIESEIVEHGPAAAGDWSDQGLRAWHGEIDVQASPERVWDALVTTPLLVDIVGKADEVVWDGSHVHTPGSGEGASVRFELRERFGGAFEGTCIEFDRPRRIGLVFMRVGAVARAKRPGRRMRKAEREIEPPANDSPQSMMVIGYTIEPRRGGATTRVALKLWTPDERLVFKDDPIMSILMSLIGPRLYQRQIDKHLRRVRAAVSG